MQQTYSTYCFWNVELKTDLPIGILREFKSIASDRRNQLLSVLTS
jgi:hypothetical protein